MENGRIVQSNFHDYPVLRMNQMPVFEIYLMPSNEAHGGVGVALPRWPMRAATGKRTRTFPVTSNLKDNYENRNYR